MAAAAAAALGTLACCSRSASRGKPRLKDKEYYARHRSATSLSSVELISSASSLSSASESSASMSSSSSSSSSVVRVVLWSGVVEVYAGVVLACTVIGRHPPGLCLAHTDVFSNPHRATLRPLEPLFPGQKFFLLPSPTSTSAAPPLTKKKRRMKRPPWRRRRRGRERGRTRSGSRRRERCCANDFYKNRERWAESKFKSMVERGLATEQSLSTRRSAADRTDKKRRRKTKQRSKDVLTPSSWGKAARSWEPSLPSVQEEAAPSSPEIQIT